MLGCALELELELGEAELAPPEAEPDFDGSLEADPLIPEDELLEAPGELGLEDAPAEGVEEVPLEGDEDELLLEGDDDGELDGEDDVLELDEPALLLESGRSHAARPNARATANARVESFMCPPWLGNWDYAANCGPDLTP